MNITETLKKHGLSKIQFATDFYLSRPTLDEYIKKFENGDKLPKEKYQLIFESLFKADSDSGFDKAYSHYKRLIDRDRSIRLDDFSPELTDKIFRTVECLKRSALSDDNFELINYVSYIAEEYSHVNELVKLWVMYFNELNGLSEYGDLTEKQRAYLGAFYMLNRSYLDGSLKSDESDYAKFIVRISELKAESEKRRREIHEELHERIDAIISKRVEEELKAMPSNATNDEIVKKIMDDIR